MKLHLPTAVLQLLTLANAAKGARSTSLLLRQSTPIQPTEDPFYTPTGSWQSAAPGTILNHRPVPHPLKFGTYVSAYQLLYRTTDNFGNASATVTTVVIPPNADFSKLCSYQPFEDSADPNCGPSYTLQIGEPYPFDTGYTACLDQGWVVNIPDYEGPHASFSAGLVEGQAVLDSIRATLSSTSITQVDSKAIVALWGYSGGSIASEWASELQGSYAPELNISGAALGGLVPNITSASLVLNGQRNAALLAQGFLGLASAYPDFAAYLNTSFVSPQKMEDFYRVGSLCLPQSDEQYANKNFWNYFKLGAGVLSAPITAKATSQGGQMGIHGTPLTRNALYIYKSTLDEISPVKDTDELVAEYCKRGDTIHYVRDTFGDHETEQGTREKSALMFLQSIFNGTIQQSGCRIETFNKAGDLVSSSTIPATASVVPTPSASGSMGYSGAATKPSSEATASDVSIAGTSSGPAVPVYTGAADRNRVPLIAGIVIGGFIVTIL